VEEIMRLFKDKKAQSMLEYALLLAVVIAGILIMQILIKRGFQGGLRDSADKLGDQYSVNQSVVSEDRSMMEEQVILEEVGTKEETGVQHYLEEGETVEGTFDKDVFSLNKRTGGKSRSQVKQQTDSATKETFRWDEYIDDDEYDNYESPIPGGPGVPE